MPIVPKITLHVDSSTVKTAMKPKPREIARANRLVINKIVSQVHRATGGRLPRGSGVQVSGFRRVRAYKALAKAKLKVQKGTVWLGGNEIAARFAGKPRNVKGGARAGRHFFEGAFVARMSNGYTSVFRRTRGVTRTGKAKLIEETVPVKNLEPIARAELANAAANGEKLLRSELTKILSKRRR